MAYDGLIWASSLLLLLAVFPVVRGDEETEDMAVMIASGCIAFLFLLLIITMVVVGFTWNSWYPPIKHSQGKVKMPRAYWKKKKQEARRKLMKGSRSRLTTTTTAGPPSEVGMANGQATPLTRVKDTASWVQGWNNVNSSGPDNTYEEMALAMELGEEKEEPEFRIETTIVDNEPLELGPFSAKTPQLNPQTTQKTSSEEQTFTMTMGDEMEGMVHAYSSPGEKPRQMIPSDTPAPPPLMTGEVSAQVQ